MFWSRSDPCHFCLQFVGLGPNTSESREYNAHGPENQGAGDIQKTALMTTTVGEGDKEADCKFVILRSSLGSSLKGEGVSWHDQSFPRAVDLHGTDI